MWTLYRRHAGDCKKARHETRCSCPIWAAGDKAVGYKRQSLKTTDWGIATALWMELENGTPAPAAPVADPAPEAVTVQTAVDRFLEKQGREVTSGTLDHYRYALNYLTGKFGSRNVADITADDMDAIERKFDSFKRNTKALYIGNLQRFFKWAKKRKLVAKNPSKDLRIPTDDDARTTMPFAPGEIPLLMSACDRVQVIRKHEGDRFRLKVLIQLLVYTGLRVEDGLMLRRSKIRRTTRHIVLRTEKNNQVVSIQVPEALIQMLDKLPGSPAHPEFFFYRGGPERALYQRFYYLLSKLDELCPEVGRVHPHRFRDTFAVELLGKGTDVRLVQRLLGHTALATTEKHYAPWVQWQQHLLDTAVAGLDFNEGTRPFIVHAVNDGNGN